METSRCVVIHFIFFFIYIAGCFGQDQCYGQGCKVQCHCLNNGVCNLYTGQCQNSRCENGWSGPSCQKRNIALNMRVSLKKPHSASKAKPAVDGNKTSCFSVSGTNSQRLRVDLGRFKQPIHSIYVFDDPSIPLPERMANRKGLKVVVSPSKTVGDGVQCPPLEERDISPKGIYDMKCPSSVTGQYVFVIKKNSPRVLGMCEVEVYVCSKYTWGKNCENICGHCSNNETCDHMTGMCPNGCKSGWTGCDCKTAQLSPDGSHYCITDIPTTQEMTTESTTAETTTESTTTETTTESTTEETTESTTAETTTESKIKKLTVEQLTTEPTTQLTMESTTQMIKEATTLLPIETTGITKQSTTVSTQQETGSVTTDDSVTTKIGRTTTETTEIVKTVQISTVEETTPTQVTDMETTVIQSHSVSTDSSDLYTTMSNVTNDVSMSMATERDSQRFGPQMVDNSTVVLDNTTSVVITTGMLNNDTLDNVTDVMITMETQQMENVTDMMVNTTGNATDLMTTTLSMNVTMETANTTQEPNQTMTYMNNITSETSGSTMGMNNITTTASSIATDSTIQQSTVDPMTGRRNSGGKQLNAALYIIVPICIVLFVIFLTLLGVFLFKRRGKKKYGTENGGPRSSVPLLAWSGTERSGAYVAADEDGEIDGDQRFSSFHKDRPITKAIPVAELQDHMSKMHISQQFKVEYESLPTGLAFLCNVGLLDVNKEKNRYKDLIAYDDSRVILLDENLYANQDVTDYINAGYIDGYNKEKEYIAAQGPKNNTVEDFWKMVWQEKSSIIVMLTNLQEGNKIKCFQYWPNEDHNVLAGDITVSFEREINYPVFVIRKLLLHHNQTEEEKKVSIYHYTAWPDHGLPDPFQILTFHRCVSTHQTSLEEPLIVHCSAGVGRTGVFIGFDILKNQGESTGYIGVLECVKNMRKKRPNMIQTLDQYIFLYVILLEHFACPDAVVNCTAIQNIMSPSSASSYNKRLDKEYKALLLMKPKFVQEDYQSSLRPENLGKNRDVNILAVDKYRPFLSSTNTQPGQTPYINAVVMPSCSRNDGFLVTQLPLKSTILDLWQMIFDYNSNIIVTLDKFEEQVEESGIFWPAVGESMVIGSFTVTTLSCTETVNSVAEKMLKLSRKNALDEEEELVIKMLSVTDLDLKQNKQQVPLTLISLYSNIQKWQCDNGQWPITVMCRDGASQCGLFCATVNLIDKIDWYNEIDVFHTVRQLHIRRPEIFSTREQYEMCYQVAKAYIDASDMYRNQRVELPQSPV